MIIIIINRIDFFFFHIFPPLPFRSIVVAIRVRIHYINTLHFRVQ